MNELFFYFWSSALTDTCHRWNITSCRSLQGHVQFFLSTRARSIFSCYPAALGKWPSILPLSRKKSNANPASSLLFLNWKKSYNFPKEDLTSPPAPPPPPPTPPLLSWLVLCSESLLSRLLLSFGDRAQSERREGNNIFNWEADSNFFCTD